MGGVILAFETARQLGVRGIFAEEVADDGGTAHREFRRGFRIEAGERVLLVDDILTTGGSLLQMLPAIEAGGGEVLLAAVLVDRSGGLSQVTSPTSGRSYPAEALWTLDLPTWEPGPDAPAATRASPRGAGLVRHGVRHGSRHAELTIDSRPDAGSGPGMPARPPRADAAPLPPIPERRRPDRRLTAGRRLAASRTRAPTRRGQRPRHPSAVFP